LISSIARGRKREEKGEKKGEETEEEKGEEREAREEREKKGRNRRKRNLLKMISIYFCVKKIGLNYKMKMGIPTT